MKKPLIVSFLMFILSNTSLIAQNRTGDRILFGILGIMGEILREGSREEQNRKGYNNNYQHPQGDFAYNSMLHDIMRPGTVIYGKTIIDGDRWHINISDNNTFTFYFASGDVQSGDWSIENKSICLSFDNGVYSCKAIYVNTDSGENEWVDTIKEEVSSLIIGIKHKINNESKIDEYCRRRPSAILCRAKERGQIVVRR